MQQYNVIATTTVRPRQQQEQLRKTTIQTTIQHVAHLLVVHVDDATAAAAAAHCVHLKSDLVTFLIPRTTWKTKQEPWTTTTLQSRGTKQQQRPQPNNHQDFFLRFTRLKHVLLVPTIVPVPPITTRTRRRTTSQQEQQAILVLVQQRVIHNHTQNRCRGDCRHLFYQTVDNYLVVWVSIYYHKIIHKHVLLSSHRSSNSTANHNSDNKNNNKMIR